MVKCDNPQNAQLRCFVNKLHAGLFWRGGSGTNVQVLGVLIFWNIAVLLNIYLLLVIFCGLFPVQRSLTTPANM